GARARRARREEPAGPPRSRPRGAHLPGGRGARAPEEAALRREERGGPRGGPRRRRALGEGARGRRGLRLERARRPVAGALLGSSEGPGLTRSSVPRRFDGAPLVPRILSTPVENL